MKKYIFKTYYYTTMYYGDMLFLGYASKQVINKFMFIMWVKTLSININYSLHLLKI